MGKSATGTVNRISQPFWYNFCGISNVAWGGLIVELYHLNTLDLSPFNPQSIALRPLQTVLSPSLPPSVCWTWLCSTMFYSTYFMLGVVLEWYVWKMNMYAEGEIVFGKWWILLGAVALGADSTPYMDEDRWRVCVRGGFVSMSKREIAWWGWLTSGTSGSDFVHSPSTIRGGFYWFYDKNGFWLRELY